MFPKYLQKLAAWLQWNGYVVDAGTNPFPATLPGRFVPIAKTLLRHGYEIHA